MEGCSSELCTRPVAHLAVGLFLHPSPMCLMDGAIKDVLRDSWMDHSMNGFGAETEWPTRPWQVSGGESEKSPSRVSLRERVWRRSCPRVEGRKVAVRPQVSGFRDAFSSRSKRGFAESLPARWVWKTSVPETGEERMSRGWAGLVAARDSHQEASPFSNLPLSLFLTESI